MKKINLLLLLAFLPLFASAHDVKIDGIFYNLNSETKEAEVICYPTFFYTGVIDIPPSLIYEGEAYSVTSIGYNAFACCEKLTSVTIPNSVTSIGDCAFDGVCLTSISIPGSVTNIGYHAFAYCKNLTTITIPDNVSSIRDEAFCGCSALTSVTIGKNVTSIPEGMFYKCSNLASVTIPGSVTSIGGSAFSGCRSLASIVSMIEEPFKISGEYWLDRTFDSKIFKSTTLYVPQGTMDKYKATEGWKDFVLIKEIDSDSVTRMKVK